MLVTLRRKRVKHDCSISTGKLSFDVSHRLYLRGCMSVTSETTGFTLKINLILSVKG